jgi:hypothetical protein
LVQNSRKTPSAMIRMHYLIMIPKWEQSQRHQSEEI